jgi:type IV secretion system protein VirB9
MKPLPILLLSVSALLAESPATPSPTVREARTVRVTQKSTVTIDTGVLQSTLLVLPEDEKIAAVFEGDKENWRYDTTKLSGRFLSVKPTTPGVSTDLHIISDHGNSYSFILREVSGRPGAEFDSKVFLEAADEALRASIVKLPLFVPVDEVDRYRKQAEDAKAAASAAAAKSEQAIKKHEQEATTGAEAFRAAYPGKLHFNYKWDAKVGAKLGVQQIFADDRFTYIRANPQETPALYEVKDNKPSLVNFDFANGIYTVPKHIARGYLAIGNSKMNFWETGSESVN